MIGISGGVTERQGYERSLAEEMAIMSPTAGSVKPVGVFLPSCFLLGASRLSQTGKKTFDSAVSSHGNYIVAANCRIDNEDELRLTLRLPPNSTEHEIIVTAYQRWGGNFPAHLEGDFAIALWDLDRQMLLCCRDHFGVKGLSYSVASEGFFFSSSPQALLKLSKVEKTLNNEQIGDFLTGKVRDKKSTFFKGIDRLEPGHTLTWRLGSLSIHRYWSPSYVYSENKTTIVEQSAELLSILEESVAKRLPKNRKVGAFLSGGLDSSSIVALLDQSFTKTGRQLSTFSTTFDSRLELGELQFQRAMLQNRNLTSYFDSGETRDQLSQYPLILREQSGPILAPAAAMHRHLYAIAKNVEIQTIFDGHGGDETVSLGWGYLHDLAREGRWYKLALELLKLSPIEAPSNFSSFIVKYGLTGQTRWRLERAKEATRKLFLKGFNMSVSDFELGKIVNDDFSYTMMIDDSHRDESEADHPFSYSWHLRDITSNMQPMALEVLERMAGSFGLDCRFPMWDRRLVEFCICLPGVSKFQDGQNRYVLRSSMEGILPDIVRQRKSKLDFAPMVTAGLLGQNRDDIEDIFASDLTDCSKYINLHHWRSSFTIIKEGNVKLMPKALMDFHKGLSLFFWLKDPEGCRDYQNHNPNPVLFAEGNNDGSGA